ncbi:hypothetical protein BH18ACT3_BH18ACT3_15400 [soil metagenome]
MTYGLLVLRLVIGGVIAAHGAQKLFGWFGGGGIDGTSKMFASVGFRPPRPYVVLAGAAELVGGLLLVVGFITPLGAATVMGMMLAAIVTVHGPKGFSNTKGGWEFNATLIAAAWALAFTGPGRYSLDREADLTLSGAGWGIATLGIAVVANVAVLAARAVTVPRTGPAESN